MEAVMQVQSAEGLRVKNVVDVLTLSLDCTQKTICSLIGITQTSLSTSIEKNWQEVATNKVGKGLSRLLYVVETLKRDESLTPALIYKILITPCYALEDGTFLDVVGAIQSDDRNEFLVDVADAALKMLRSKYEKKKAPIENGLYKIVVKAAKSAAN
jgi:predicted XRE-type DNA-binding protein